MNIYESPEIEKAYVAGYQDAMEEIGVLYSDGADFDKIIDYVLGNIRPAVPALPAFLRAEVAAGRPVWNTEEMLQEFDVLSFSAPFVIVKRKSDGTYGTLAFSHSPRWYFGWKASPGW